MDPNQAFPSLLRSPKNLATPVSAKTTFDGTNPPVVVERSQTTTYGMVCRSRLYLLDQIRTSGGPLCGAEACVADLCRTPAQMFAMPPFESRSKAPYHLSRIAKLDFQKEKLWDLEK
jgi:hypothetical protein